MARKKAGGPLIIIAPVGRPAAKGKGQGGTGRGLGRAAKAVPGSAPRPAGRMRKSP